MIYQIDQSGKVEDTARPTVLAATNGKCVTLILPAADKKYLQQIFRLAGKPRVFVLRTFSACLFLLITKHNLENSLVIDHEYINHEDIISSYLQQFGKKTKRKLPQIKFGKVGKQTKTHHLANSGFKKKKGDVKISSREILGLVILLEK